MRIGVDAIRWVLVAVNFLGVGLLGYTGYHFFFPKERSGTFKQEEVASYRTPVGTVSRTKQVGGFDSIVPIFETQKPKAPDLKKEEAAAAEEAKKEEEAVEGGPLDEKWELEMTLPHPEDPSIRMAYLSQRTTPRISAGGRPPAFAPRPPAPRPTTPVPRPGGPGGANLTVVPGKTYEIEDGGKTFDVTRVEMLKLVYRSDGKLYQLSIEKRDNPWELRPEEENVGIKEAPAPGVKGQEPPPYDRGKIVRPDGKVIGDEEGAGGAKAAAIPAASGSAPGPRPPFSPPSASKSPPSGPAPGVTKPSAADVKDLEKEMEKFRGKIPPEQRKELDEALRKGLERTR